ncbi:membrane protein insertion efficiency factor YidD [bacterium]|nr:membrane protein insertion efficiency factor YidD [bacterium]
MRRSSFLKVAVFLAIALHVAPVSAKDAEWGPWPSADAEERLPASAFHAAEGWVGEAQNGSQPFLFALRTYQLFVSSQDVVSCPMYPSCSRFAMHAFATYDPLQAFLLTADRLVRDNPGAHEHGRYPHVHVGEQPKLRDLPEDHRLW